MINIPIIQVSLMYILKDSAIKSIKISVKLLYNKYKENECKTIQNVCEILLKQFVWMLDVENFRTIMLNIAKTNVLLVKKETSDVLSSNIVLHDSLKQG